MVKIAIRDDDMNFFTKVEDVEKVYEPIKGFPVSFAVIPMVTDVSTKGRCSDTRGNIVPRWVGNNSELVVWLKEKVLKGQADVLLHGITHGYVFVNKKRYAEMQWRKETNLKDEIALQRNRLSELFDYPVSVFVAPSNKISKYGIKCVASNKMNFSGIIPIGFQREFTIRNVSNYAKRWWYRLVDHFPYPGVMQYSTHKEINACLMQGYNYLVEMYHYCEKINCPMAVNVHYWHLRDDENERKELFHFIDYVMSHNAEPVTLSSLLK